MEHNSTVRPLRDAAELHKVVTLVLDHADPDASGLEYRLVGTGAALAQGVRLPVGTWTFWWPGETRSTPSRPHCPDSHV